MLPIAITPGDRYGRLAVIREVASRQTRGGRALRCVLLMCDCGTAIEADLQNLRKGNTSSCGCWKLERISTHGLHKSPAYRQWSAMKRRCYGSDPEDRRLYRDRGIVVCDRWRNSFENFLADMGHCPPGLSLDRIDNDGPYEPTNCRWATQSEQNRNRRDNLWVVYNGGRMLLLDACPAAGVSYHSVNQKRRLEGIWTQAAFDHFVARAKRMED